MIKYKLPKPSSEQEKIIQASKKNLNILVDSVAGSGKTTTILHVLKDNPHKTAMVLTYNARLKKETRDKINQLNLQDRVNVHSFHSMGVKYYDTACCRDDGIIRTLKNNKKPHRKFNFDLVVIDEVQDMTQTYFELVHKFISDMDSKPQLIIIGDKNQSIYGFNNADSRFIIHADKIFASKGDWIKLKLSISFRITDEMSKFLNNIMLGDQRLKAVKKGSKVRYCIVNPFIRGTSSPMYKEVVHYLNKYDPGDIFILAPSVRKKGKKNLLNDKNPIHLLMKQLSMNHYPIYTPEDDDNSIDENFSTGKIIFSTFHQSKGLERPVVLVHGFDQTYFRYYNQHANDSMCPNELYVACTRAKEQMSVFHSIKNNYLPFMNLLKPLNMCLKPYSWNIHTTNKLENKEENSDIIRIEVSELMRYVDSVTLNDCAKKTKCKLINEKEKNINFDKSTGDNMEKEAVGQINNVAVKIMYELYLTDGNYSSILSDLYKNMGENSKIQSIDSSTPEGILYLATQYLSLEKGFFYKTKQIKNYSWIDNKKMKKVNERMNKFVAEGIFEMETGFMDKSYYNRQPYCYLDCVDTNGIVWEFITNDSIEQEDKIIFAIKAFCFNNSLKEHAETFTDDINKLQKTITKGLDLINKTESNNEILTIITNLGIVRKQLTKIQKIKRQINLKKIKYQMLNVVTGEVYALHYNKKKIEEIIESLIFEKYVKKKRTDNKDFISKMIKVREIYNKNNKKNNVKCIDDDEDLKDNSDNNSDNDSDNNDINEFAFG